MTILTAVIVFLAAAGRAFAQDGANVMVVVNDASEDSQQIAARYVAARHIPPANIVHIRTAATDEIDRQHFGVEIEEPIAEAITAADAHDRILYIVLTKGIPLRVRGTAGLDGTVASTDSELTLLYRKLLGSNVEVSGRISNPYFAADRPVSDARRFSHAQHDIYLVTRLDGFTRDDVFRLIEKGANPVRAGGIYLSRRSNSTDGADGWLATTVEALAAAGAGDRAVLSTGPPTPKAGAGALGYYSWGSNDPKSAARRSGLTFVPGALAAMFVSTDARTFKEPPAAWSTGNWADRTTFFEGSPQSLTGDLVREGITGAAGYVTEPFLDAAIRPQILFPAYASGFNLVESFYMAMPYISWQTVIVGDPLCAPFEKPALTSDETRPALDPDTALPKFFSVRRLGILAGFKVKPDAAKLLLKASALLTHGDVAGGRDALERVVEMVPNLSGVNLVLAGIYEQGKDYDKAAARYRAILTENPDDVRAMNNLAYLLAVHKRTPADALPLAERAYKLASDKQPTRDLGFALLAAKGAPANALPFSNQAFDLSTTHAQIADTLGWTQHLLAHDVEADRILDEALEGDPDNAEILVHVAVVKGALGQTSLASAALTRALAQDSSLASNPDVKALQSKLERK